MNLNTQSGASKFGWSYLSAASDCPYKWYLKNLYPWPGSRVTVNPISKAISAQSSEELKIGLEPSRTSSALNIGLMVHRGFEAFYLSGVRGGADTRERSLEAALEAIRSKLPENPAPDELEDLSTAQELFKRYYKHYGNDREVEVVIHPADGQPMVEAELWVDLGYKNYQFTSRLDLIYRKNGYLWALEHKTTSANALNKLITRFHIDGQVTGQFLQLASHFPDEPIGGITLNAAVKDRGAKSNLPDFIRRDYARTNAQLEKFRLDITRKLSIIDQWVEQWIELVANGMSYDDAALAVFDGSPSGMQCVGVGFACEFLEICRMREILDRVVLDRYQPRIYEYEWQNPLRKPNLTE